ncbi:MAG: tetratricopeptide repeat protein [Cyclobacteriaceae bacterium]|nr:tetratricopeptide repeat protein [Cyclobacteriaceae bacterium]
MRILGLLLILFTCRVGICQNDDDKVLIQNFYETCKAKSYGAFLSVNKGVQLLDTKQYDRALNNFKKTLEKDSTCCDAWYLIGHCYQKRADYFKAIEACDKSLSINPDNPSALVIKANSLFLVKDTLTAMTLFQKTIDVAPDKIDGYYGLALMLYYDDQKKRAQQVLNEMDERNVTTVDIRDNKKIKNLRALTQ